MGGRGMEGGKEGKVEPGGGEEGKMQNGERIEGHAMSYLFGRSLALGGGRSLLLVLVLLFLLIAPLLAPLLLIVLLIVVVLIVKLLLAQRRGVKGQPVLDLCTVAHGAVHRIHISQPRPRRNQQGKTCPDAQFPKKMKFPILPIHGNQWK